MTEEEIAINNAEKKYGIEGSFCMNIQECAYIDGFKDGYNKAKEEMQQQGLALQSDMDKTIEQNIVLKKQIEKMRNFENCDYQLHITDCPVFKSGGHISCKKCPHWILQEIKEK